MELIKKLKQTEAHARELVEQARAEAARIVQDSRQARARGMHEAEQERRKAIEEAIAAAESEGVGEVEKMKAEAERNRGLLAEKAKGRIEEAAQKVTGYLKR